MIVMFTTGITFRKQMTEPGTNLDKSLFGRLEPSLLAMSGTYLFNELLKDRYFERQA